MVLYDNLSASIDLNGRMQTNEQFIYLIQQTSATPTDSFNSITIKLKKSGEPNVDIKGVVMSGDVVDPNTSDSMTIDACSTNTITSSEIDDDYDDYTFNFASNHSLEEGKQFGLGLTVNSSSDNDNEIHVGLHHAVVTDYQIGRASGSVMSCSGSRTIAYTHPSGYSMVAKLTGSGPSPTSGTRLPPPPIILGGL